MGQKKLKRFAELTTLPNVLQYPDHMRGKWNEFFGNTSPIVLELACGKGEYALALGKHNPSTNFIGVDLKGNRIWVGAKKALQGQLKNIAFLRTQIDRIHEYFDPGEISEIWIPFPDPQLRTSKARKRLTHPKFLRLYKQFLMPGGYIHLKTDSPALYRFTKQVIEQYHCLLHDDLDDLYRQKNVAEELKIRTHYESLDIAGSRRVHYLKFSLPRELPDAAQDKMLQEYLKVYEAT